MQHNITPWLVLTCQMVESQLSNCQCLGWQLLGFRLQAYLGPTIIDYGNQQSRFCNWLAIGKQVTYIVSIRRREYYPLRKLQITRSLPKTNSENKNTTYFLSLFLQNGDFFSPLTIPKLLECLNVRKWVGYLSVAISNLRGGHLSFLIVSREH